MNPMAILNQIMANNPNVNSNPMAKNAMDMLQSGNTFGLQQLAENLAKQKGVNIDDIRKQIGF